ncbi:hypothetical protein U1Q18_039540, partial [Sarracenia purpurea var. burkii]
SSVDSGATAEDFSQRATVLGFSIDRSKIGSSRGAGPRDSGSTSGDRRLAQAPEVFFAGVIGDFEGAEGFLPIGGAATVREGEDFGGSKSLRRKRRRFPAQHPGAQGGVAEKR